MALSNDIARLRQRNTLGGSTGGGGFAITDIMNSPMMSNMSRSSVGPPPAMPDWGQPSTAQGIPGLGMPQQQEQGPPEWQGPNLPEVGQTTQPTSIDELLAQVNRFYTPSTAASDRFNTLLGEFPQRQEPSFMRKLVAGGIGLDARQRLGSRDAPLAARGDPTAAMEKVLYAPYIRDVADWTAKADPYYKAADLENRQNINERNLTRDVLTTKYNQDRLAETSRIADERNQTTQQYNKDRYEIGLINAKAREAKANGATVRTVQGVAIISYPNGEVETLRIPGTATDAELANIRGEANVRTAEARGAAANTNTQGGIVARGQNLFEFPDGSLWSREADGTWKQEKPPGTGMPSRLGTPNQNKGTTERPTTKAQDDMAVKERMREIAGTTDHSKWFTFSPQTGEPVMKKRPSGPGIFSNDEEVVSIAEDQAHWDKVRKYIYPWYVPPTSGGNQPSSTTTTTVPSQQAAPNTPKGRIPVYDKNGDLVGHIPDTPEQRELAIKQGYKVR